MLFFQQQHFSSELFLRCTKLKCSFNQKTKYHVYVNKETTLRSIIKVRIRVAFLLPLSARKAVKMCSSSIVSCF